MAALLGAVACVPRPEHRRAPGGDPVEVAFAGRGRVVVSDAAYRVRVLDPSLGPLWTLAWPGDPADGSIRFGPALAANAEEAEGAGLVAAGALVPAHLAGSGEVRVAVWSEDGTLRHDLRAPGALWLGRLYFLPPHRLVALVHLPVPGRADDRQAVLQVWDLRKGGAATAWPLALPGSALAVDADFDPLGTRVIVVTKGGDAWTAPVDRHGAGLPAAVFVSPASASWRLGAVAVSPDGAMLAGAHAAGVLAFAPPGRPRAVPGLPPSTRLRFAPEGATRLGALTAGGALHVHDFYARKSVRVVAAGVRAFAWRRDGRALATIDATRRIAVWKP